MKSVAKFVISLDFELMWGMKDLPNAQDYEESVLGVRKAIPLLLKLFSNYDIHATWATVGIMLNENKSEIEKNIPIRVPLYENAMCSSYNHLNEIGQSERDDKLHYAGSLFTQVKDCNYQEIGTHTYSHYYCLEKGSDQESFACDVDKACEMMRNRYGITVRSIVFPRNQYDETNLSALQEHGIIAYRGNPDYGFDASKKGIAAVWQKMLRTIDAYLPIFGSHTYTESVDKFGIVNVKASRFFRPASAYAFLEKLKVHRIKKQMLYAAKHKQMFHLWWHPHNMGKKSETMMKQIEEVLKYYFYLNKTYGMISQTMEEYARDCLGKVEQKK